MGCHEKRPLHDAGDILNSGGESRYYGDDGNDLVYVGLTAVVKEVLDGIDTVDTTSWADISAVMLVVQRKLYLSEA